MKALDAEFDKLLAERQSATARPDAKRREFRRAMRIPSCRW